MGLKGAMIVVCVCVALFPGGDQAADPASRDTDAIGTLIGNLGAVGAVIWLVYHTQTKVLPSIVSDFRQELAAARSAHANELAQQRTFQREELAMLRQTLERDSERDERSLAGLEQAVQQLAAKMGAKGA